MTAIDSAARGVKQSLSANSDLKNRVTGVWDGTAPQNVEVKMPYVVIDSWVETPRDTHTAYGRLLTFLVHVWSDYEGVKEAAAIGSLVLQTLNRRTIEMLPWLFTDLRYVNGTTLIEGDGVRHFVARFEIRCQSQRIA